MVAVNPNSIARNHAAAQKKPEPPKAGVETAKAKGADSTPAKPALVDYTIKKGDTVSSIARMHKTDVDALLKNNPQIKNRDKIYAGSVMKVPAPPTEAVPAGAGAACPADAAPAVRQPVDAATQAKSRRAATGREEQIAERLHRAKAPTTPAEAKVGVAKAKDQPGTAARPLTGTTPATPSAAATTPAPATAPTAALTPRGIDTPAARANNANIATTTQRLVDNGLVTKNQAAELTNGVLSKEDMEIAKQVSDVTSRVADFAVGQHKEIARDEDAGRLPKGSSKRAEQPVVQALDAKNDSNGLNQGLLQQQSTQVSAELREALKGIDPGDVVRFLTAPFKNNPVTNLVEGITKGK
jgi:LysM repeat protein